MAGTSKRKGSSSPARAARPRASTRAGTLKGRILKPLATETRVGVQAGLTVGPASDALTSAAVGAADSFLVDATELLVPISSRLELEVQGRLPGFVRAVDIVGNLFDAARPGRPVVRPDDLLAMRLQLVNLAVTPGVPPRLGKAGAGVGYLILHHPPQSIAEEVFPEVSDVDKNETRDAPPAPKDAPDPPKPTLPADSKVDPPPIRARAAGESRIVFVWPDELVCDYTIAGVLQVVQTLAMKVTAAARPRGDFGLVPLWPRGRVTLAGTPDALALGAFSLRQTLIAMRGGTAAEATVRRRLTDLAPGTIFEGPIITVPSLGQGPQPALPGATETAIELPWRLILSPHADERWRHATEAVTSPATQRTELWHTRLLGGAVDGRPDIQPPRADPSRTVRAVWATTGPWGTPMQGAFPTTIAQIPKPGQGDPFLTTLNDYDRYQISHLTSNASVSNYNPQPVDTHLLMLSALGGWLDSRGDWDPPGLDVESWVHRASMGRDHYVRVVYRGLLFPLGHRAVLVKVSERKFHPGTPGNAAYLRQRFFMVVRERERTYDDAGSVNPYGPGNQRVKNEFPFSSVRILTTVTPTLSPPALTQVAGQGQLLFWPATGGGNDPTPFRFRVAATDLDGRDVEFDLPLIFMSNSLASPRKRSGSRLVPLYASEPGLVGATEGAALALQGANGWLATQTPDAEPAPRPNDRTVAPLRGQRVALAPSSKPGDTAIEADSLSFGAHIPDAANATSLGAFRSYSAGLSKPMFFPRIVRAQARIGVLSQLTGSPKLNQLRWNDVYARLGFDAAANKGQVFVDVPPTPDMAALDFSKQGDRSGGFVMPNLRPSAISRVLGPTAGAVGNVLAGKVTPTEFFPATPSLGGLPLPLLFGCIPLSAVIDEVGDLVGQLDQVPKFASEASTRIETFFADLTRLYQFVRALATQPASLGEAALAVVSATLDDLAKQALAFGAAQAAPVQARIDAVLLTLDGIRGQLLALQGGSFDADDLLQGIDLGDLLDPPQGSGELRTRLQALKDDVAAAPLLPAGFRQGVNGVVASATTVIAAFGALATLYQHGKALFDALKDLLDNPAPGQSLGELITKPDQLAPKLQLVADRLGDVRDDVAAFPLLEGPPRKLLLGIIDVVQPALAAVADILGLLGEELVVRFDWKPPIKSWALVAGEAPLFVVHDKHAFIIAVEARMKRSGGPPKIQVLCGLHHFDLVLIAPASFIELNFEKIEFSVDPAAKMNVDVVLSGIKFVGPLSFVETLRDLIPLDGFSDPPFLDITPQGIDAGFSLALPTIPCGMLNLSNVSLGAGFTVPFIGQPLSVRFNFCTREQPFHLTVYGIGGGGFFGITIDPSGVQILEAAFEFGAALAIDFGVASGSVSVMAGIYFRMEKSAASLAGYFRIEGHVDVLGLITASIELYLELRYEFETGKCIGRAALTIEIEIFMFSMSVEVSCERKIAGSNGDPTFRQKVGLSADPALPLADELAAIGADTGYAWRDYCEAFA